jgi:RNA polymerase-binding transcription factor DksA
MTTRMPPARTRFEEEFRDRLAAARLTLARTVAATDEELETLEGHERRELDEIGAAQARLKAGLFGACESCHKPIPLKRLRAMPAARRCALCQGQLERQG